MKKYSFLTKLTFFGCILSIFPVIFIGMFSYFQSTKEIQKQVNRGQLQMLGQINSNVELVLRTVNHAFDQLVSSTVMMKVMNEPFSSDNFILYKDLRKEISSTQSFYSKLQDIVIVNLKQNWMIKNSGFYRFDSYLHQSEIAGQMQLPNTLSWELNPSEWFYSEEASNSIACPYTISLVKKLPDQKVDKFGLIFANLPTCSIASMINYKPREFEEIMILDDKQRILFHSDQSKIGQKVNEAGLFPSPASTLFKQSEGQFQTELNDQTYAVSYLRSSFNNWIYVSVISIDSLTEDSKKIGRYTTIVCLIIVAIFIMIAWLGSRRMYNPIRSLMKQIGGKTVSAQPRFNEFELISSSVQDLFQSKSQLEDDVRRHMQQSLTFFLIKLFHSGIRRQELIEKLELFGFKQKLEAWRFLSVITLQIDTLDNTRYKKEDMDLLLFSISNIIDELVPEKDHLPSTYIDQTMVTLIGGKEDSMEMFNQTIYAITESIQRSVEQVLNLRASIGISLPFSDLNHASIAYREGLEALKHRIYLGDRVIISFANINAGKPRIHIEYPQLLEAELFDAVILSDTAKSREALSAFIHSIFKTEMTPQEYQFCFVRFLNNLMVNIQQAGISLNQLQYGNGSLYEELTQLQFASEIESWFWSRVLEPLIQVFQNRKNSQFHNISEKMIDMIHNNYTTPLSIERCASELHYNANYLSSVFRKETNLTFGEYLTNYRLTMAKKWLASTDMTIKDMAEKLQYGNPQNFIRSFRKQESVTPGQYREASRK
ncbi:AraC family transcriptional regulator [Paenibacillus cremeus]|uniref:AraC family transcriptional regulator n=1 Tax=Paenibacillus cremeus TaxID=2163881 RepID=A0A559JK98_9BACL|nr:helix-turn-helix domain-containing protein [Paenibacillus cremeus]TVY00317.1 AraC family transcriptional regulator [Paenibacillus cremeus]